MKIRRFEGKDAAEALQLARMALGPDAVVLQTRAVKATGLRSLVGRPRVEVLAAVDRSTEGVKGGRGEGVSAPVSRSSQAADWQGELTALRLEVARLRLQIHGDEARGQVGSRQSAVGSRDERCPDGHASNPSGLPTADCRLPTDPLASSVIPRTIEMREGACTAVALVGPTGVGKSTTLAKLAAAATQVERKRVALMTLDCYRLGAVEQLEAYAHLLGVPLRAAYSAQEIQELRRRYQDYDLVLVDTVGRSPRNTRQIKEMGELLQAAELQEIHLVLDAGASAAKNESVVHGFWSLHPTHLLLSKLDEAPRCEEILASALECGLPLSYLTCGQRVPEDLAPADRAQLERWLCGGL